MLRSEFDELLYSKFHSFCLLNTFGYNIIYLTNRLISGKRKKVEQHIKTICQGCNFLAPLAELKKCFMAHSFLVFNVLLA